jgi:N,N'-diacetyllegionaminate synthase
VFQHTLVAEIGSVHDGSFGNALKLIDLAASCGANVVKFQTHLADAEMLPDAPAPSYFQSEPRREYFQRTGFTLEQWRKLAKHCAGAGVQFLSSPFSIEAVDLLEEVGVDAYKIASGEVSNVPLLERIAQAHKPVLLSSGMSDWNELERAVRALRGASEIVPMQCTTAYPCPPEQIGLNVIGEMQKRFGLPVGFSDHTRGPAAAIAAAALGAICVEKHLTFSTLMYGSDAPNAMEPPAFTEMAAGLRSVWTALSHPVDKGDLSPYRDMKRVFEKSIVTARPLTAGQVISRADLAFKKPGDGVPAWRYPEVVGRRCRRDLPQNHKVAAGDFE